MTATPPDVTPWPDVALTSDDAPHYQLRLFITGSTPRSTRAIENLRKICAENLDGRYELEVIDVYERPETTRDLQIVATPTLVKVLPEPLRRIIGDLSDELKVLAGLDLAPRPPQQD